MPLGYNNSLGGLDLRSDSGRRQVRASNGTPYLVPNAVADQMLINEAQYGSKADRVREEGYAASAQAGEQNFAVYQEQNRLKMQQAQLAQQNNQFTQEMRQRQQQFDAGNAVDRGALRLRGQVAQEDAGLARAKFGLDRWNTMRQPTQADLYRQKFEQDYQAQGVDNNESMVREALSHARTLDLTPEGQRVHAAMAGEAAQIMQSRSRLRPDQYQEMLGKWLEKTSQMDLSSMTKKPIGLDQAMSENFKDLGNGYGLLRNGDKMEVRQIGPTAPPSTAGSAQSPPVSYGDFRSQILGGGKYDSLYKQAGQQLQDKYMSEHPDAINQPPVSSQDIHAQIEKNIQDHYGFLHAGQQQQQQQQQPLPNGPSRQLLMQDRPPQQSPPPADEQPWQQRLSDQHALLSSPIPSGSPRMRQEREALAKSLDVPVESIKESDVHDSRSKEANRLAERGSSVQFAESLHEHRDAPVMKELQSTLDAGGYNLPAASIVSPIVVKQMKARGHADPVGETVRVTNKAINEGKEVLGMLPIDEQEAVMKELPITGKGSDEYRVMLKGDHYMTENGVFETKGVTDGYEENPQKPPQKWVKFPDGKGGSHGVMLNDKGSPYSIDVQDDPSGKGGAVFNLSSRKDSTRGRTSENGKSPEKMFPDSVKLSADELARIKSFMESKDQSRFTPQYNRQE